MPFLAVSGIPAHETVLMLSISDAVVEDRPKFGELYDP